MIYTPFVKRINPRCLGKGQEIPSRGKNSPARQGQGDFTKSTQIVKLNIEQVSRGFVLVPEIYLFYK
jgi:hypothetical protein